MAEEEEIRSEAEAVQAVYSHDCHVINDFPPHLAVRIVPRTADYSQQGDRRYNHYCGQMLMVVNSFYSIMGYGAATPYTTLAQKAMSRHFQCLKDAITSQLKIMCELLGKKDATGNISGITKGETRRLRLIDQSFRQQRVFHQTGMMEQKAWQPQRGLLERSVNILRAWLFEHFLQP